MWVNNKKNMKLHKYLMIVKISQITLRKNNGNVDMINFQNGLKLKELRWE